jgi:hypothetical protein
LVEIAIDDMNCQSLEVEGASEHRVLEKPPIGVPTGAVEDETVEEDGQD